MSYIPEGGSVLSPYLILDDANAAIDFYIAAFGAEEKVRMNIPGSDKIMHAEIAIGGATIMLSQENPTCNMVSPKTLGNSPVSIFIYVPDVDTAHAQALTAGATELYPVADMFWGDRMGSVTCPFGYTWSQATHVKDPTPEEMEAGAKTMMEQMGG
ncbi:MAG: VOC family protein [Alphaproteobacteria bacterium]|nr:VOC family protein [Alphaproteobacteria bacterium]